MCAPPTVHAPRDPRQWSVLQWLVRRSNRRRPAASARRTSWIRGRHRRRLPRASTAPQCARAAADKLLQDRRRVIEFSSTSRRIDRRVETDEAASGDPSAELPGEFDHRLARLRPDRQQLRAESHAPGRAAHCAVQCRRARAAGPDRRLPSSRRDTSARRRDRRTPARLFASRLRPSRSAGFSRTASRSADMASAWRPFSLRSACRSRNSAAARLSSPLSASTRAPVIRASKSARIDRAKPDDDSSAPSSIAARAAPRRRRH